MKQLNTIRKLIKRYLPRKWHPIRFYLARLARERRKRQSILGQHAIAIMTDGRNGKLLVAASDMEVGRSLAFNGSYNWHEIAFHLDRLTDESEVLFVGAHVGSLLVPIAKRVRSVVGVEANPQTFTLLEMNVQINGLKNVELFHLAAGDREGEIEFMMHTQNTGASKIKHGKFNEHDPIFGYDNPEISRVLMRRLDDCIPLREFDLIVMDIEGSEYLALKGMPKILSKAKRMQLELVPFLLAQSGVKINQVLDLLTPYFDVGRDLRQAMDGNPSQTLSALAKEIECNNQLSDIYLEKSL